VGTMLVIEAGQTRLGYISASVKRLRVGRDASSGHHDKVQRQDHRLWLWLWLWPGRLSISPCNGRSAARRPAELTPLKRERPNKDRHLT